MFSGGIRLKSAIMVSRALVLSIFPTQGTFSKIMLVWSGAAEFVTMIGFQENFHNLLQKWT